MPQVQPDWLIYVVIALAVFCVAFFVAWRMERLDWKASEERCAGLIDEINKATIDICDKNAKLHSTETVRDQWIKQAQDLTGEVEELKKQLANDANGKVRRNKKGQFESMKVNA